MSGQYRDPAYVDLMSAHVGRSSTTSGSDRTVRDLADPALWTRSAAWAQQRRVSVPAQRRNERRRRKMALAMSVAMVGGSAAPTLASATTGSAGDTVATADAGADGTTAGTISVTSVADAESRALLFAGSSGNDVRDVQSRLGVVADGHFGERTTRAVERFQGQRELAVDGIVGPQTWSALLAGGAQATNRGVSAPSAPTMKVVSATTAADGGQNLVLVGSRSSAGSSPAPVTVPASSDHGADDGDAGSAAASGDGSAASSGRGSGAGSATDATGSSSVAPSDDATPKADPPSKTAPKVAAATDAPASSSDTVKPMSTGSVSSPFGQRGGRLHAGMDIAAPIGTAIRAYAAGTVAFSGTQSGYGNIVCVDHGDGLQTCYAHMSKNAVAKGDKVQAGDVVGYVGMTGHTTGPHLHFEVRKNGSAVNPASYYANAGKTSATARSVATTSGSATTTNAAAKVKSAAKVGTTTASASLSSGTTLADSSAPSAPSVSAAPSAPASVAGEAVATSSAVAPEAAATVAADAGTTAAASDAAPPPAAAEAEPTVTAEAPATTVEETPSVAESPAETTASTPTAAETPDPTTDEVPTEASASEEAPAETEASASTTEPAPTEETAVAEEPAATDESTATEDEAPSAPAEDIADGEAADASSGSEDSEATSDAGSEATAPEDAAPSSDGAEG